MAKSYPDIQAHQNWVDLTAVYPAIRNRRVTVQAKGGRFNHVFFGGAQAPAAQDGIMLGEGEAVSGTSDHIWVRGTARIGVLEED